MFFQIGFHAQNNSKSLLAIDFNLFFGKLIFDPNVTIIAKSAIDLLLCMMADFQNGPISPDIRCFFKRFFAQNNSKSLLE